MEDGFIKSLVALILVTPQSMLEMRCADQLGKLVGPQRRGVCPLYSRPLRPYLYYGRSNENASFNDSYDRDLAREAQPSNPSTFRRA